MKILMLGWEFPPFKSGGLGTYLYAFTRALKRLGAKTVFIMPYTGREIKEEFVNIIQARNAAITKSMFSAYCSWDLFERVEDFNRKAVEIGLKVECDVIHCHDWMTFPAGITLKALKEKPLVVTIHSTEFDRTGQLFPNERIKEIELNGLREADVVVTVSNFMKKQLVEKYGIKPEKIRVIYNAIDLKQFKRIKCQKPIEEKIVLFLGRLTIQKGCCFFLEAAKKVLSVYPNAHFLVVGSGDLMHELISKAIDLGIYKNVTFTGFQDDVSRYYSIADLFVMPSVSEPFGLTALEAVACGTPVIVSKQSGVSEVLKNCFKVDFWNSDEMANKILGLLNYPSLKEQMQKASLKEIKEYRSWQNVAQECLAVYEEVKHA